MLDQSFWKRPVSSGEYLPWTMGPWLVRASCGIWHEGLYFVLLESHAGLLEHFDHPPQRHIRQPAFRGVIWIAAAYVRVRAGKEHLRHVRSGIPKRRREIDALLIQSDRMKPTGHLGAELGIGKLEFIEAGILLVIKDSHGTNRVPDSNRGDAIDRHQIGGLENVPREQIPG